MLEDSVIDFQESMFAGLPSLACLQLLRAYGMDCPRYYQLKEKKKQDDDWIQLMKRNQVNRCHMTMRCTALCKELIS